MSGVDDDLPKLLLHILVQDPGLLKLSFGAILRLFLFIPGDPIHFLRQGLLKALVHIALIIGNGGLRHLLPRSILIQFMGPQVGFELCVLILIAIACDLLRIRGKFRPLPVLRILQSLIAPFIHGLRPGRLFLHPFQIVFIFSTVFHQILLVIGKVRKILLQLHGPLTVFTQAEEQGDLVAGSDAFCSHACSGVELRQLIEPFFIQLLGSELLQGMDQLGGGCAFCLQDLVFQKEGSAVLGSQICKLPVEVLCLLDVSGLYGHLRQLIEEPFSHRSPFKGQKQDILCLLIFSVFLIDSGHHAQEIRIPDSAPVDAVGDLHCRHIVPFVDHLPDLLDLNIELVLIHILVSPQ